MWEPQKKKKNNQMLTKKKNDWDVTISVMDGPGSWIVEADIVWVGFEPMLARFETVMGLALVWVLLQLVVGWV